MRHLGWLGVLFLLLPSIAAAQGVLQRDGVGGEVYCDEDLAPCGTSCGTNTDPVYFGQTCRCVPHNSVLCITDGECPGGTTLDPVSGTTLTLCLTGDEMRCPRTLACFESPDGNLTSWARGDCDRDGLANAAEQAQGSAPCTPAPDVAFDERSDPGCNRLEVCLPEAGCDAGLTCERVDSTGHFYCRSGASGLFCCGGFLGLECPGGSACTGSAVLLDGLGLCRDPGYCADADYATRVDCFYRVGDEAPRDDADQGDCDQDGTRNADEPSEIAVCQPVDEPDAGAVDAGAPDAGPAPMGDGGPPADAGRADSGSAANDAGPPAAIDAGPGAPSFGGGGGCRCRASAASPVSGSLALPFALALLSLRRRRRR